MICLIVTPGLRLLATRTTSSHKLARLGLRHSNLLPGPPHGQTRPDANHPRSRPVPIAFDPVRLLLDLYEQTSMVEGEAREPKPVFFSFDAVKTYGEKALGAVAEARVIRLGEGSQVLYGFT